VTAAAISATVAIATGAAYAVTPPTPKLTADIEVYAPYQGQTLCDPHAKPGVVKFRDLILKTYPGQGDSGITRACDVGGKSEHKEGRAWDWRLNAHSTTEYAKASQLISWLFATDSFGNRYAMARRLGIMYIIFNKKIWYAGSTRWDPYSCSGTTDCHEDHMHFSFGWAGALAQTSYWTGKVSPVIPPPGTPPPVIPPATPPTPKFSTADIEVYAPNQGQTLCDPIAKLGVVKFRDLILKTYPGTGDLGITLACNIGTTSEHKEGRAWDWRVNAHSTTEYAKASQLVSWLFATDSFGNRYAMARRLGIMYIIFNKKIWHAGMTRWDPYSCSGITACHEDNMHLSFGWAGALAQTSYWTGTVSPVIQPPGSPPTG
jgi:hypothetical protein